MNRREELIAYLPLRRADARRLRDGAELDLAGNAATSALLAAHDLPAVNDDAEFTALSYAGLAALQVVDPESSLRLVAAVEVSAASPGRPEALGCVRVERVLWSQVQALFADEPANGAVVAAARGWAAGRPLAELADDRTLDARLADADLLWFAPGELDALG